MNTPPLHFKLGDDVAVVCVSDADLSFIRFRPLLSLILMLVLKLKLMLPLL